MAINDISFLAFSEQESLLVFKDSNLDNSDDSYGAEFLSQLHNADNSSEILKKGNTKVDSENSIAIPKHKQAEANEDSNLELDDKITPEAIFISTGDMLEQISSAQAMSTSVIKSDETINETGLESTLVTKALLANTNDGLSGEDKGTTDNLLKENDDVDQSAIMQNTIYSNADLKSSQLSVIKNESSNSLALNTGKYHKSNVAEAIEGQLNHINKNSDYSIDPIVDDPELVARNIRDQLALDKPTDKGEKNIVLPVPTPSPSASPSLTGVETVQESTLVSASEKGTVIDVLMAKDTNSIKTDKVITSLAPEQATQLNAKAMLIDNADTSTANIMSVIEQPITDNVQANNTTVIQSFSSEINSLNLTEKHMLLTQLNAYNKMEGPQDAQLKALKQTVNELETSIEINLVNITKAKSSSNFAGDISNTIPSTQENSKLVSLTDAEINKATSSKSDDLTKQLDLLSKEGFKNITAEQSSARVAQIFTQITTALNSTQSNGIGNYEELDLEQGVLDTHFLQSQQLQGTAQVKQGSIDPSVMQAINIVKSDAAKLLQERVSSMLSISNKEAEIRLDPPEMGSMQIRIRSDAEQAQINFVVQNQQAKEALEQSMPRLREMLAEQGLELGESTISYGQSGGDTPEKNEDGSNKGLSNNNSVIDKNDEQTTGVLQSSQQQTSSSIDYYA